MLSSHHLRRDLGQRWGAETLSGFALPQQGAWACWCHHTYPQGCPHLHLQFVLLHSALWPDLQARASLLTPRLGMLQPEQVRR